MIRAGVRTDSKIEGGDFECGIAKQNKWERAMAYSASVQTFQEEYLAFLEQHGAHFDEKYLWDHLRARSYRTLRGGSFGMLSQALRAWLRSCCPSGTKAIRSSKGLASIS
jgi:hypothetical protein